jgi:hypothetical protein
MDTTFQDPHKPTNQLNPRKFPGLVSESLSLAKVIILLKTLRMRCQGVLQRTKQQAGKLLAYVEAQSLFIQSYQNFIDPSFSTCCVYTTGFAKLTNQTGTLLHNFYIFAFQQTKKNKVVKIFQSSHTFHNVAFVRHS